MGLANHRFRDTRFATRVGKDLAPYRIGNHSNPQNSPKIHQKYSKNTIFGISGVFLPYVACGGVFLFCRGPSFSQDKGCHSHMQNGSPAPSYGAPSLVCCSKQHGRCMRSVHPESAQLIYVRETREGWNCRFQKTPRTEGGDKVPAVWTQGFRQVCLSRCPKSQNL